MTHALTGPDQLSTDELADLAHRSRQLIARLQDPSGAYPASPSFSAYQGYSWFRDGAFIADAMSAAGEVASADGFHTWCADVLLSRRAQIQRIVQANAEGTPVADAGMLPTRFTFAGVEGDDDWWDFQLDGYGTWLWAVVEHVQRHDLAATPWLEAIRLATDYLIASWSRPCYDWWEEHTEEVHVSTLGCVIAGLEAVLRHGLVDEHRASVVSDAVAAARSLILGRGLHGDRLSKWLGSAETDASLASLIAPLGIFDGASLIARATVAEIDDRLSVHGGVHRYLADTYYGGGQWPLLSCMLGLALLATGDRDAALAQLQWAATTAHDGEIPEQVDRHLLAPERQQEWVQRWGTSADPLLWSSAMYLRLALALDIINPEESTR